MKIVIKTNGTYGIYMYIEDLSGVNKFVKFVVAEVKTGHERSGQIVDGWISGEYFWSFYDAEKYYTTLING